MRLLLSEHLSLGEAISGNAQKQMLVLLWVSLLWKERTEKNGPKITKGILFCKRGEVIFLKERKM